MAKPTERALKRKPMAVILLTTLRGDVPSVPPAGREFEWFTTEENLHNFFDQNVTFHTEDVAAHDDMAYLAVEVVDTSQMTLGRIDVQPPTEETEKWMKAVQADITLAFTPVTTATTKTDSAPKKVRARQKSTAANAVEKKPQGDSPEAKATRLKQRLAAKKEEPKKSETGDAAPKAEAPKPKPKAPVKKKADESGEPVAFVVKKAATASA